MQLKDIKNRLKDDALDLSLCELEEVPVREIETIRKVTNLNLSTNMLTSLPITFANLKYIVVLDLSKNMLTELPENLGEMTQLKHLDLYANQISRLPLSLGELKNLRWLDLKENPLTSAVASIAGPCSNPKECQACARSIVSYLSKMKVMIEEERKRRLNDTTEKQTAVTKKENKKKKKKSAEKKPKTNENKSDCQTQSKISQSNDDEVDVTMLISDNTYVHKSHRSTDIGFYRFFTWMIISFFVFSSLLTVALVILSWHYEQQTNAFLQNAQTLSGLPLKSYYKHAADWLQHAVKATTAQMESVINILNDYYKSQFKNYTKKDL